jgi:hypothetical protein
MPDRRLAAVKLTIPGKYQISAVPPEAALHNNSSPICRRKRGKAR